MIWLIILLIFFGGFFWLTNLGILSWHRDWPLLLIILGAYPLFFRLCRGHRRRAIIRNLELGRITPAQAEEQLKK